MQSGMKMALAGIAGAFLGALGMNALHAATAVPQAYLIANIQEIKDNDSYQKYRTQVAATQAPYKGHFLVRGATPVAVDKSNLPKGALVIVAFPSMKELQAWWNSPAYSAIRPLRENATVGQLYAVEGVPPS